MVNDEGSGVSEPAGSQYRFEEVVSHAAPMALLDSIDAWEEGMLQARVTIRPDAPFVNEGSVPAWVGIEYMAQAIAAYAGCRARRHGLPVKIGFLVGSRRYECNQPCFPCGATLTVRVEELMEAENGLGVFQCVLRGMDGHADIEATANLNVFQPASPEEFLRGEMM